MSIIKILVHYYIPSANILYRPFYLFHTKTVAGPQKTVLKGFSKSFIFFVNGPLFYCDELVSCFPIIGKHYKEKGNPKPYSKAVFSEIFLIALSDLPTSIIKDMVNSVHPGVENKSLNRIKLPKETTNGHLWRNN